MYGIFRCIEMSHTKTSREPQYDDGIFDSSPECEKHIPIYKSSKYYQNRFVRSGELFKLCKSIKELEKGEAFDKMLQRLTFKEYNQFVQLNPYAGTLPPDLHLGRAHK